MEPTSAIQKTVMRRVRIIRASRMALSLETGALILAAFALYGIGREVWVAKVFANAPSLAHINAFMHFWVSAFLDTRLPVQLLSLVVLVAVVYLARETARAFVFSAAISVQA
ncbi:MAG: hypothetical protein WDN10_02655 [bacterium]